MKQARSRAGKQRLAFSIMLLAAVAVISALVAAQGPLQLDESEREDLVLDLVAKVRWPFAVRDDIVALATSGDVGTEPAALHLGGFLYHVGTDAVLALPAGCPFQLPFTGLETEAGEPGTYRLTLRHRRGEVTLGVRVHGGGLTGTSGRLDASPPAAQPCSAEPAWLGLAGREMERLGYRRGPHLRVELVGLEKLLPPGATRRDLWGLLWNVLLPCFRRLSSRSTIDPGPDLRGREALAARRRLLRSSKLPARPSTRRSEDLPGLPWVGLLIEDAQHGWRPSALQESGFDTTRFPHEDRVHHRLLERFLAGLRWPLPAQPEGAARVERPDDAWDRHGLQDHDGIDLGSTLLRRDQRLASWPAGTVVAPPHVAARPLDLEAPGGRAWIVEIDEPPWRLRVLLFLYHVTSRGVPSLTPADRADVHGGWRTSDPLLRCLGWPKGNHAHLEVVGIYRGDGERKRLFAATRLSSALSGAAAVAPAAEPVAYELAADAAERPGVWLGLLLHRLATAVPAVPGLERRGDALELRTAAQLVAAEGWRLHEGAWRLMRSVGAGLVLTVDLRSSSDAGDRLRLLPGRLEARLRLDGDHPWLTAHWAELVEELLLPQLTALGWTPGGR